MIDNKKDCIYCQGKGFQYTDLMHKSECKECSGTGWKVIKEKRKTIAMEAALRDRFQELAMDHRMTAVEFMRYVVNYFEHKAK